MKDAALAEINTGTEETLLIVDALLGLVRIGKDLKTSDAGISILLRVLWLARLEMPKSKWLKTR